MSETNPQHEDQAQHSRQDDGVESSLRGNGQLVSFMTRITVAAAILVIAFLVTFWLVTTKTYPAKNDDGDAGRRVQVMVAQSLPVQRQFNGYGVAEAMDSADVPARVSATVASIPKTTLPGAAIAGDQLLVQLDDTDFLNRTEVISQNIKNHQSQLASLDLEQRTIASRVELLKQDVQLAREELERATNAFDQGVAVKAEVDRRMQTLLAKQEFLLQAEEAMVQVDPRRDRLQSILDAESAQLRLANLDVARCKIKSPLDGVIQSVDIEIGENVQLGSRVARVINLRRIEVPLRLPASSRSSITVGDPVRLNSAGAGRGVWHASVARISPEDALDSRTLTVYAELEQEPDAKDLLAPGSFLAGTVQVARSENRWVVPRRAIQEGRIQYVKDDVVMSRPVEVDYSISEEFPVFGLGDDQWAVLLEPLPKDMFVVVNSQRSLLDGMPATPWQAGSNDAVATSATPLNENQEVEDTPQ
ncbi:MAG: HlyD family efflux transporter periplasmic adaptor subunit [Phycisphaerales bacterium]|nr:HlyD family efflux transporter periplasmic adaptor subunit [Phycisphaerales bacterium]